MTPLFDLYSGVQTQTAAEPRRSPTRAPSTASEGGDSDRGSRQPHSSPAAAATVEAELRNATSQKSVARLSVYLARR